MGDREGCTPSPDSDNSGEVGGVRMNDDMKAFRSSNKKSEKAVKEMVQWSALPDDLVQCIADRLLVNVIDYLQFRAVCKPWRSATADPRDLRKPPQLPWLMLSFDKYSGNCCFFRLSDRKSITLNLPEARNHKIRGCTDGWLVLIYGFLSSAIRLFDPLTGAQIHLPALTTIPEVRRHQVQNVGLEDDVPSENAHNIFIDKLVMSCKHRSGDVIVMASIGNLQRVVFARPGDDEWSEIHQPFHCEDILCYQGDFYVIDNEGVLAVFDIGAPAKLTPIAAAVDCHAQWFGQYLYLVESKGDLLLVHRYGDSSATRFLVFKVENPREGARLVEVKSLGDEMLFLGASESTSISSKDYPGWRGNCIYFKDVYFVFSANFSQPLGHLAHFGDDFGVFSLEDGVIESRPCYPDNSRFIRPSLIWFAPNVSRDHDP